MKKLLLSMMCCAVAVSTLAQSTGRKIVLNNSDDGESVLTVYLPERNTSGGMAVLDCPGGGYSHLAMDHEGHDWAEFYNQQGIALAVLKYRMPKGNRNIPLGDAYNAMKMLRDSAAVWNLNPRAIGIQGFSAGGHLASSVLTHADMPVRPNFGILFYPVISMNQAETHKGSCVNFLGDDISNQQVVDEWTNYKAIAPQTVPPTIILTANDDKVVPPVTNGIAFYSAMCRAGNDCSLHVYPRGGHGFGFRSKWEHHRQMVQDLASWLRGLNLTSADNMAIAGTNGKLWADTDGKHINAHGGNIIQYGGKYYWYGENRPDRGFTTEAGVSVYSSDDLKTWKNEGIALAVSEEKGHDIERGCIMERPKVVYNPTTKKFVMLFHLELKGKGYAAARVAFAESDTPTGPFTFLRSQRVNAGIWPVNMDKKAQKKAKTLDASQWKDWWTPEWRKCVAQGMYLWRDFKDGQMSRDMTVYIDEDGKAYHITSSQENLTLLISELTPDWLGFTGKYTTVAPGGQNEAPTIMRHGGKYWMICSGCTGWAPNEARMFVSESIWGPWKQLPSPFTDKNGKGYKDFGAKKTFGAQGTSILKLDSANGGEPSFIFMADVWNPEHLSQSLHLWLPIQFAEDGTPVIPWK